MDIQFKEIKNFRDTNVVASKKQIAFDLKTNQQETLSIDIEKFRTIKINMTVKFEVKYKGALKPALIGQLFSSTDPELSCSVFKGSISKGDVIEMHLSQEFGKGRDGVLFTLGCTGVDVSISRFSVTELSITDNSFVAGDSNLYDKARVF